MGLFGGPEPRQIQTEKKSVAMPLSGKEEPKGSGVSVGFERSAKGWTSHSVTGVRGE